MFLGVSATLAFLVPHDVAYAYRSGKKKPLFQQMHMLCTDVVEKVACSYEGDELRVGDSCLIYHRFTGDLMRQGECSKAAEEYTLADCTWLQVRHYEHIHRPPIPYIQGVQSTEQTQGPENPFTGGAQTLTDIDDTIKCSGGHQPAGIDATCKGTCVGALYPGVVAFYKALTLGHREPSTRLFRTRFPIPLSARPQKLSMLLGMKKCKNEDLSFRQSMCSDTCTSEQCQLNYKKRNECGCFGLNTKNAQYGNLFDYFTDRANENTYSTVALREKRDGQPVFESGGYASMAYTKFQGFLNLVGQKRGRRNGPPMVFVGDNGQGDFSAAQMMLRFRDEHGTPHMHAAFIHYVRKDIDPESTKFKEAQKAWAGQNIYVFRDYLEAGKIAWEKQLISQDNFNLIQEHYKKDLDRQPRIVHSDDNVSDDDISDDEDGPPEELVSQEDAKEELSGYRRFLDMVAREKWNACSSPEQASSRPLKKRRPNEERADLSADLRLAGLGESSLPAPPSISAAVGVPLFSKDVFQGNQSHYRPQASVLAPQSVVAGPPQTVPGPMHYTPSGAGLSPFAGPPQAVPRPTHHAPSGAGLSPLPRFNVPQVVAAGPPQAVQRPMQHTPSGAGLSPPPHVNMPQSVDAGPPQAVPRPMQHTPSGAGLSPPPRANMPQSVDAGPPQAVPRHMQYAPSGVGLSPPPHVDMPQSVAAGPPQAVPRPMQYAPSGAGLSPLPHLNMLSGAAQPPSAVVPQQQFVTAANVRA